MKRTEDANVDAGLRGAAEDTLLLARLRTAHASAHRHADAGGIDTPTGEGANGSPTSFTIAVLNAIETRQRRRQRQFAVLGAVQMVFAIGITVSVITAVSGLVDPLTLIAAVTSAGG